MKKRNAVRGEKNVRVLVISAHPDDVDFGCAGTLAAWAKDGAEIFYAICTSGEKGSDDPNVSNQALALTREKEQRAAAKVVGAKEVIFLRKPDGELQYSLEFKGELVRVIRQVRPDILFTHDPANRAFDNQYIFHSDHRIVGELVFDAAYPAALNRNYFSGLLAEGLAPHTVSEIYFFAAARPDTWVDITSTIRTKIRALRCHASQISNPDAIEKMVRSWFAEWGREKGMAYAECFRRLEIYGNPSQRMRKVLKERKGK
ncbi:MAG TPA: PIG-L deacetylase family protein [Thermodesulfobacteriota bacterium]|nr:PIG-L deacetylase family protein [Thermodesulfobacteriota bacterium]